MKCKKCGQDNVENSKFCNNCGTSLENNKSLIEKLKTTNFKNKLKFINFKTKKVIIISITSLVALVLLSVSIFIFTNPVVRFKTALKANSIEKANNIYNNNKYNEDNKDKMISFVRDYALDIKEDFTKGKISYDDAINKLNNLKETNLSQTDVSEAKSDISTLNNSKLAFSKAEEYLKQNDYINALKEYGNVIKSDANYESAQEAISENKEKYKTEVLNQVDEFTKQNQYSESIQLLNTASTILGNDNDIKSKLEVSKTKYKEVLDAQEAQKKDEAKANQLLVVDSANIMVQSTDLKSLYPDMLQAFITNKSDKTVKDMNVGFLAYDSNGYPLKIKTQFNFSGGNFEFTGNADNINLVSGAQFGSGVGWSLDTQHGITIVMACVKDATFYDGTTWNNPYYQYWLKDYKEKQIQ